jgi:hypothetical protein
MIDEHLRAHDDASAVQVTARVEAKPEGDWAASLVIVGDGGEASVRTLTVASCDAAAQAVALAVALAAGPLGGASETPPPEDPPPDAPPPEGPPPDARVVPPPAEPTEPTATEPTTTTAEPSRPPEPPPEPRAASSERSVRGFVAIGGGIAGGILPRPTGDVLVEGGVLGRRWQATARADYVVQRPVPSPQAPRAGGDLSIFAGSLLAGPVLGLGPRAPTLEVPAQAGVSAGAFRAAGFGTDADRTRVRPFVALLAEGGLRWTPFPRLALGVHGTLVVALVRHTFTLGAPFDVTTTGIVGGRGLLTVALRL